MEFSRRVFLEAMIASASTKLMGCSQITSENRYSLLNPAINDSLADSDLNAHYALRSIKTIHKLPFLEISNYLSLNKAKEVTILYPAAGSHIAALEIGIQLQRMHPQLFAKYILTEISSSSPINFEKYIKVINPFIKINSRKHKKMELGFEITFNLSVFEKKMELTYALGTSNKEVDFYSFKQDYALNSDIILFHDSFEPHDDLEQGLSYILFNNKIMGKQKVIIFDDISFSKQPDKTCYKRHYQILIQRKN